MALAYSAGGSGFKPQEYRNKQQQLKLKDKWQWERKKQRDEKNKMCVKKTK